MMRTVPFQVAVCGIIQCEVMELPLSIVLFPSMSKAVCILLTLLHLGIRTFIFRPTLPAFISPDVLNYLLRIIILRRSVPEGI